MLAGISSGLTGTLLPFRRSHRVNALPFPNHPDHSSHLITAEELAGYIVNALH